MRKTTSSEATKQLAATLALLAGGRRHRAVGRSRCGQDAVRAGCGGGTRRARPGDQPHVQHLADVPAGSLPLYHFDLYRLEEADELEDIGYYETIDGDGASFVEWGEKFPEALPYGYLEISIRVDDEGNRSVRTHAYGDRARRLLFVWAKDSKSRLMKCAGGTA